MAARRYFFVNRYYYPDHSATSQILSDLAFDLASKGRDVQVVTTTGAYDEPNRALPSFEVVRGVTIHRVCTPRHGRGSLVGRALDYVAMYKAFAFATWRLARAGDVVVAKTDPPLLSAPLAIVSVLRGFTLVNWLQDLYPEVAGRLGIKGLDGPFGQALKFVRNASLRRAALNVAIGHKMQDLLADEGVARDRLTTIANWCDDRAIMPVERSRNPLISEWGLDDAFVVGYSGNLGRAHEFATLLDAAELLRDDRKIVFLFVGGGHLVAGLRAETARRGLEEQFQFRPYQDYARLSQSLSAPDVHWVSLRPELEGLIVPSKFYGIAAAGRAIIAVTATDGELAREIRDNDCGYVCAPGDGAALAAIIRGLRASPAEAEKKGRNARDMLERAFRRDIGLSRWDDALRLLEEPGAKGRLQP